MRRILVRDSDGGLWEVSQQGVDVVRNVLTGEHLCLQEVLARGIKIDPTPLPGY